MDDRLDSWKQIAAYLRRGVTTVQRWEQEEGLPVHRLPHAKKGSVFAFEHELDAWLAARAQAPGIDDQEASEDVIIGRRVDVRLAAVILATVALAAAGMLSIRGARSEKETTAAAVPKPARMLPRPLANGIEPEIAPSLSPDGSHVVYARWTGRHELYLKPVAGGEARAIPIAAPVPLRHMSYPTWSPRGDLIAFLGEEAPDVRGLFVVAPGGGTPRRLTAIAGIGICWSPEGDRIGFVDRNSTGEPFSVFAVTLADGRRTRLTVPPAGSFGDTHCAFSPDGRSLAVARFVTRDESHLHVVALDAGTGAESERLTDDVNGINGVAWTPDGSAIVFGAAQGLWKVSAGGRRERPVLIAGLEGGAALPSFSRPRTGKPPALAYQHYRRDVNVWRRTLGAEAAARVTDASWWDNYPSLLPDGTRVAFTSNRTGANELWIANADGSSPRQITFHNGPLVLAPQWSPDGRQVAFSSAVGGNRDIYVISADGSGSERLTMEPSDEGNPTWSRDGRWIYFRSNRAGLGQLWKVPRAGGSAVRVTAGEGSQGFEAPDGRLLYFVRNPNVPGLWSVPVDGGPETFVAGDVYEAFWAVADRGVAFVPGRLGNRADGSFDVRFYDFASRKVATILTQPVPNLPIAPGFTVSRDVRTVLWSQTDTDQDDVMLLDPWVP